MQHDNIRGVVFNDDTEQENPKSDQMIVQCGTQQPGPGKIDILLTIEAPKEIALSPLAELQLTKEQAIAIGRDLIHLAETQRPLEDS